MDDKEIRKAVSNFFISRTATNSSPWQRPWAPGDAGYRPPINAANGKLYRGYNAFRLMLQRQADPRWVSREDAQLMGWQPLPDAQGIAIVERGDGGTLQKLEVFNGAQFRGVPPLEKAAPAWNVAEILPLLIAEQGVKIVEDQREAFFYDVTRDQIHAPPKDSVSSPREYNSRLLHQAIHASGHPLRENRDFGRSFVSREYAAEELRAQMATVLICSRLHIPFFVDGHDRYWQQWITLLSEEHSKIFQMTGEAELMAARFIAFGHEMTRHVEQERQKTAEIVAPSPAQVVDRKGDRIYLFVPFEERHEVAKLRARLDTEMKPKRWWIPATWNVEPFTKWLTPPVPLTEAEIKAQFSRACDAVGLILPGDPIMDDDWHGVPVANSKHGKKTSGAYLLATDGSKGIIKNSLTGETVPFYPDGLVATDERTLEERRIAQENRDKLKLATYERVGAKCEKDWERLPALVEHEYVARKGIEPIGLRRQGKYAVLPVMDTDGRIWNLQKIAPEKGGDKLFVKDGRKSGCFFPIGQLHGAKTVLFVEGYATGVSLHMATGLPVVVCFDSGNIKTVMKTLETLIPDTDRIICADNDQVTNNRVVSSLNGQARERHGYPEVTAGHVYEAIQSGEKVDLGGGDWMLGVTERIDPEHYDQRRLYVDVWKGEERKHNIMINNSGMEKALEAAATAANTKVVAPRFADAAAYDKGYSDFNDLHCTEGLSAVQWQIASVVDLVKGRADAERCARELKHNLIEVRPPANDGRYIGQVLAYAGCHAVQDAGHDAVVAHPFTQLSSIPAKGAMAQIHYQDGRGTVLPTNEQSKGRQR